MSNLNFENFMLRAITKGAGNVRIQKFVNAIQQFEVVITDRVKTAATDGIVILVNEEFFLTLNFQEQMGLLIHEIMHCRMDHPRRFIASRFHDQHQANVAMDFEINSLLKHTGVSLPEGSLFPSKYNLSELMAWEWYNLYLQENQLDEDPEPQGDESQDDESQDGESQGGESQDGESQDGDGEGEIAEGCHAAGELAKEFCPDRADDLEEEIGSRLEAVEMSRRHEDAIENWEKQPQQEATAGNEHIPNGAIAKDGEIVAVPDHKRWQSLVIDTFRTDGDERRNDWSQRSRRGRQQRNSFMPKARHVNGLSLALVVDASGSCTSWFGLWRNLANELVEECPAIQRLEIITHDTCIIDHLEWNRGEGPVELKLTNGGGTCHRSCIPYADSLDVDGIILFTDNETYWPNDAPASTVLTVMCPDSSSRYTCPFGPNVLAKAE